MTLQILLANDFFVTNFQKIRNVIITSGELLSLVQQPRFDTIICQQDIQQKAHKMSRFMTFRAKNFMLLN